MDRRAAVSGLAAMPLLGGRAFAADKAILGTPPSVVTSPPRLWGKDAPPDVFPDPDVITVDPAFGRLIVRYAPIRRLGTGYLWAEGPAWSGEGQYLSVQRRAGQHPVPPDLGDRRYHAVPQAFLLQQRQLLRFPGPPAFLPALFPPRGALGTGRRHDGDRRQVSRARA